MRLGRNCWRRWVSLFKLLVFLAKKQQDSTVLTATATSEVGDATVFQVQNLHVHLPTDKPPQVRQLLADPEIVEKAKEVMRPATLPGYKTIGFYDYHGEKIFEADKDDARGVLALPQPANENSPATDEDENDEHIVITAVVKVMTQVNDGKAQWRLKWAGRSELASMDDLPWLEKFQTGQIPVQVPLFLNAKIDIVTSKTNPDASARFHVLEVLSVVDNGVGEQSDLLQ